MEYIVLSLLSFLLLDDLISSHHHFAMFSIRLQDSLTDTRCFHVLKPVDWQVRRLLSLGREWYNCNHVIVINETNFQCESIFFFSETIKIMNNFLICQLKHFVQLTFPFSLLPNSYIGYIKQLYHLRPNNPQVIWCLLNNHVYDPCSFHLRIHFDFAITKKLNVNITLLFVSTIHFIYP